MISPPTFISSRSSNSCMRQSHSGVRITDVPARTCRYHPFCCTPYLFHDRSGHDRISKWNGRISELYAILIVEGQFNSQGSVCYTSRELSQACYSCQVENSIELTTHRPSCIRFGAAECDGGERGKEGFVPPQRCRLRADGWCKQQSSPCCKFSSQS